MPDQGTEANQVEILFDGSCPLCRREIAHYQRLDSLRDLVWTDVSSEAYDEQSSGVPRDAAMRLFHVRSPQGTWKIGAHGFLELWTHLPFYRHLGKLLTSLRLAGLLDWAYVKFAAWRYKQRCESGTCIPPKQSEASK